LPNYYIIVNPAAGRGQGLLLGKKLEKRLPELTADFKLEYTVAPWDATEMADKASSEFEVIAAAGGDGTLHEIVNGLKDKPNKLALIPEGTGNDFARAMNIPADTESALQMLFRNKTRKIDVCRINDRWFHNGAGIGFDAWAVENAARVTRLRGNAVYWYSILRTLISYKPVQVSLQLNGETLNNDFFMITIANGTALGGGFMLTPDAEMDDGLFDLCIIENTSRLSVARNLLKVFSGKHKDDPRVQMKRADKVTVTSEEGFAVHADGELISLKETELHAEIIPGALEFVC